MIDELVLDNPEDNIRRIVAPLAEAIAAHDDRGRQRELVEFLESIASFWPDNLSLRAALFDLSLVSDDESQAYRAFLHLALNCNIQRLDDFGSFAARMPQLRSWLTDLSTDTQLAPDKQADLASLARSLEPVP